MIEHCNNEIKKFILKINFVSNDVNDFVSIVNNISKQFTRLEQRTHINYNINVDLKQDKEEVRKEQTPDYVLIDEYNSRNSSLADLMRRLGICEELGSGLDKAVAAIELFQLPPLRFTVQEARTTVTLFAYRKYADLDRQERIYACYQHACLKYVTNDKMTNLTLRERLGIDKQNYPMASRIIKDTLIAGKIKEEKTENQSRNNKGYVPFWA